MKSSPDDVLETAALIRAVTESFVRTKEERRQIMRDQTAIKAIDAEAFLIDLDLATGDVVGVLTWRGRPRRKNVDIQSALDRTRVSIFDRIQHARWVLFSMTETYPNLVQLLSLLEACRVAVR